jgi:hypothetical protein
MRITFKKQPIRSGLMRLAPSYYVNRNGSHIATIQELNCEGLWFWYGNGQNTAGTPKSLDEVKSEIKTYFSNQHQQQ